MTPEQELEAMRVFAKSITSSKKNSVDFLKSAGILNDSGKLAKQYRSA
jgi:CRISPR/Cas system-associated endonuclease Cas3-HD